MDAIHSKSAFVYGQVRRALRSGRYAPGQRIDPAKAMEMALRSVRVFMLRPLLSPD